MAPTAKIQHFSSPLLFIWSVQFRANCCYSWPRLVWPYTEELFSQLLVGENRFRLVLPNCMSAKNVIGCLFFHSHLLFLLSFSTVSHSFLCSMVLSNKDLFQNGQIGFVTGIILHFSCISCPIEQRKLWETVGGELKVGVSDKKSSLLHSWHSYGPGALIGINFRPQTAEK